MYICIKCICKKLYAKIFNSKNYSLSFSFFLSFFSLPSTPFSLFPLQVAREARRVSYTFICTATETNIKILEPKTNVMTNRLRSPVMRIHRCDIPDMFHGRPSPLRLRTRSGMRRASRVARDSRSSELNALGDSALARPIASTTPLLVEPMADRTLSRLYLPVCAHLASVDPASGR